MDRPGMSPFWPAAIPLVRPFAGAINERGEFHSRQPKTGFFIGTSMATRIAISKKKRFEVFKRDFFTCQYCGATPPSVILQVDHINPVKSGGGNSMDNLITACQPCNLGKSATPLTSVPKSLSDKAAEVAEKEAQLLGYNKVLTDRADRIATDAWEVVASLEGVDEVDSYNRLRLQSIKRFLGRMPAAHVIEAAETTRAKFSRINDSGFRYFCGICWGKIRESENG